jgi:hypothetical protein
MSSLCLLTFAGNVAYPVILLVDFILWFGVCHCIIFFSCGATAQRGPGPPPSWGFEITHNDTPQWVGLLWARDQPVAETSTWQDTHTHTLTTDTTMLPAGFEPAIPSERPRTLALDNSATGISQEHKKACINYRNVSVFRICLQALKFIFRRVRTNSESACQLCHVCLSARMHERDSA